MRSDEPRRGPRELPHVGATRSTTGAPRARAVADPPARLLPVRAPPSNLPSPLTRFIGREQATADVTGLLASTRLVTITGTGGVGKTRLATEVARQLGERYPGGVWLVELAPLADPRLVPEAIASVLNVREAGPRPVLEVLIDTLRQRRLLLLLDNCEHLITGCAAVADALLRNCAELQILATSRQPLGLAGETVLRLPPMPLPSAPSLDPGPAATSHAEPESGEADLAHLMNSEAVRLFADRAAAALPTFAVTAANTPAIARICAELDGIPLALELAAVWVRVLSPDEIAAHLSDRFRLLTGGDRAALPRQQTLEGTLDWSYALLDDPERILLRRLAVFEGGWTLEAAETICGDAELGGHSNSSISPPPRVPAAEVLGLLAHLVDQSLVLADVHGPGRFSLLETTRQYSRERLVQAGEAALLRSRHASYFTRLARQAEPELLGPGLLAWLERLERERDNLRAALRWAIEQQEPETELQLAAASWEFWWMRGYLSEGQAWLEGALARANGGPSRARARALHGAGILVSIRGDPLRAAALMAESVATFRELGDVAGVVRPLLDLAVTRFFLGDLDQAEVDYDEALRLARAVGEEWGLAYALYSLASFRCTLGQFEAARSLAEESIAAWRALGDPRGIAYTLWALAGAVLGQGDPERAETFGKESLRLFQELGETWGIVNVLVRLAGAAAAQQHGERAVRLQGAAEALAEAIGLSLLFPPWRMDFEQTRLAREAMGSLAFENVRAAGRALTLDEVVAYALAAEAPDAPVQSPRESLGVGAGPLSRREEQVATLITQGLTNRQIADALVISELTADTHVRNILRKLGAASRAQIAAWATAHGLAIPPSD